MSPCRAPVVVALILAVAPLAQGQELKKKWIGGFIGAGSAALGDLDGDGVQDFAAYERTQSSSLPPSPEVRTFSGATLHLLYAVKGPQKKNYEFGLAIADSGDVNGDGTSDFIVGAGDDTDPQYSMPSFNGAVYEVSGTNGSILGKFYGHGFGDELGHSVAGLGDVDGDGVPDFLAGAPQSSALVPGYVVCLSGKTMLPIYQIQGVNPGDEFGTVVRRLSDHDGDGIPDFVVVSPGVELRICSGIDGSTILSIPASATTWFPGGVAEVDDVDGDGVRDIAFGFYDQSRPGGEIDVYSIATQTTLRVHPSDYGFGLFGTSLAAIADVDGDGVRDYVAGANQFVTAATAPLYSGRTGERLYEFADPLASMELGGAPADVGDLDGDGRSEFLINSDQHLESGTQGALFLYSGNDLWLNAAPKAPKAGALESLSMHGAPTGQPVGVFLTAVNGTPTFQLLAVGISDAVESFTLQGTVPGGLAGSTMTLHAFALDANSKLISSADEVVTFQ
jgi:hypothetical protein